MKACIFFVFLVFPSVLFAEWKVITHNDIDTGQTIDVAHIKNNDGYSIEIYKDVNGAVRSRFNTSKKYGRLTKNLCPSFQIDAHQIFNRSINNAKCISHSDWVEFVLGYLVDYNIDSTPLYRMQNGNTLTFRFAMETDGYRETSFTLAGSSRVLLQALGTEVFIRKTRQ